MLNNVFTNNDIISTAMQATQLRHNVISHNIANVDVPGFKRSIVEFENLLQQEIDRAESTNTSVNLNNLRPNIHLSNETLFHRLDGNNVDIEVEMAALYQNSTRFEVMSMSVMNNYRRIGTVLNSNI
jgi:flagellar basal-body rod protein FlgB